MIGIIGAMDAETDGLKKLIDNKKIKITAGVEFIYGKLHGKDIVCAKCNPGKVNAAMCTQIMITEFRPELIVNSGIAGSLTDELDVYNVAIAESCVQYDCDTSVFGTPPGMIEGLEIVNIPCDKGIIDTLKSVCENDKSLTGIIATGDSFITDENKKNVIKHEFNAIACEMEGGAIGQVCYTNKIKYGVLRVISDSANKIDYSVFKAESAKKSIEIINKFIKVY